MKAASMIPLSLQQKGIFSEIKMAEESSLFHIAKVLELKSSTETKKLKEAFFQLLNRHNALRMQVDEDGVSLNLEEPKGAAFEAVFIRDEDLHSYLEKKVKQPYDLTNDPLFNLNVIKTDSDRSFLLILAHHLVTDLWSIGIFLDELFSLLNGEDLIDKPNQYSDFIQEQHKELQDEKNEKALKYWQDVFRGFPMGPQSIAPINNAEKKIGTPSIEIFQIPKNISNLFFQLSRNERIQHVSILLTIYSYLFFLRTGKTHFCIGTTSNGRKSGKWARCMGLFSNPVPLIIKIDPESTFVEDARSIQKQLFAHLRRYQLPLNYLVDHLRKEEILEDQPLFQHLFVYQQVPAVTGELKKLSLPSEKMEVTWKDHLLSSVDWNHPFSPYDLTFYMHEIDGELRGFVEYLPGQYPTAFVKNLIQEFQQLSAFFSNCPDLGIANFEISHFRKTPTKEKSEHILEKLIHWSKDRCDRIALFQEDRGVTYGELQKWTNKIARFLLEKGLRPGDALCIQMNHSFEALFLMIAAWKCGAAFVPIDITIPQIRVEKMQKESGASILIKQFSIEDALHFSGEKLPVLNDPSFPAYLIFTSGSTGKPKGVVITHENLSSYLKAIECAYPFHSPVHFAVHSSLSFDLTITSLFYPLYFGESAHLFDRNLEISELFHVILSNPLLTHLKCTPSHLKCFQWIDSPKSNIQALILGGETLSRSVISAVEAKFCSIPTVINEYGPSEVTVGCIFHLLDPALDEGHVPIGTPLENADASILGPFLNPLPESAEGTLFLMGDGVSMGYWNDPKRTAQAFLPDIFGSGKRMYDSGDIATKDKNGEFHFLHREDSQVKIRGYRVELNEIREVLLECKGIRDAFVSINEEESSKNKIITAFVVLENGVDVDSINEQLNFSVPPFMIPNRFIRCQKIPLTTNGKVNEKKLNSLIFSEKIPLSIKKLSSEEEKLIGIWSYILKVDKCNIGLEDSFFALGGDSIKAIQVVSLAQNEGIDLTARGILEKKTIRAIAPKSRDNEYLLNEKEPNRVPLTPIQYWFFSRFQGNFHHYNQAVTLKNFSHFDLDQFRSIICKIAASQPLMRATFPESNQGEIRTIEEFEENLSIVEKKVTSPELEEETLKLQKGLNIHKGPLIKIGVFRIDSDLQVVIVMHHLITDGVSWHLFLEALSAGMEEDSANKWIQPSLKDYLEVFKDASPFCSANGSWTQYPIRRQKKFNFKINLNSFENIKNHFSSLEDVAFASFVEGFFSTTNIDSCPFQFERHGRDIRGKKHDFSSLIGWFTQLCSCKLVNDTSLSITEKLQTARDALKSKSISEVEPQVLFNYLGEVPSGRLGLFSFEPVLEGLVDDNAKIPYSLQANLFVYRGELIVEVLYDLKQYPKSFEEDLKDLFVKGFGYFYDEIVKRGAPSIPQDFGSSLTLSQFNLLIEKKNLQLDRVDQILPLLPSEKGIFLHVLTHPGTREYHQQLMLTFKGKIDEQTLQSAFAACIQQFPSMRTTFHLKELDEPQKIIYREGICRVEEVPDVKAYLERDSKNVFSLETLPLIHLAYHRKNTKEIVIVLCFHHLVMDGWSLGIFFEELLKKIGSNNLVSQPLPAIGFQSDQESKDSLNYWKALLSPLDQVTHLPKLKRELARKQTLEKREVSLTHSQSKFLVEACQEKGVTIAHLLHASWAYVLSLFLNQPKVVFGTVVSGRGSQFCKLENQVGQLSMVIPIIANIVSDKSIFDLACDLQRQVQESESHLDFATGEIEALSPFHRDLIDHILVIENYPFSGQADRLIKQYALPFELIATELKEQSQYPFTLSFFPNETLTMECQFDPSGIKSTWVESILDAFQTFLDPKWGSLDKPLREISVCSQKFLYFQNKDDLIHSIPEQFKINSKINKNRVALVDGNLQITYETLDFLSDRIAINLIKHGIQPDENIGICLEKSYKWIVVWLGILKAGAAYTPLRQEDPIERRQAVLRNANVRFIFESNGAENSGKEFETLHFDQEVLKGTNQQYVLPPIESEQLAYTLFTSGTTGTPKGIAMSHGPVINHLNWIIEEFDLSEKDRMLQLTAFSFDVSVCELYALLVGGTLIIAPYGAEKNLSLLQDTVEKNQISFVQMVPSLLEALLVPETKKRFGSVRQVLCGADTLHPHQLEKWIKEVDIPLSNLYGLTETCIDSTHFPCSEYKSIEESIPIGKAIRNVWTYHFDKYFNPLPNHAKGNLFIGGRGLARCYVDRPDLTALRFLPDPNFFGKRMFSTSDQVTLDPLGNFFFTGRVDNQVKVRGLRIELDEIRVIVSRFESIEEVFIKLSGKAGYEFICCYYTASKKVNEEELKKFAHRFLPSYLIPSLFIYLNSFPLTQHGKIDGNALPEPSIQKEIDRNLTEKEKKVVRWISSVLHLEEKEIDPDANFFDLGGNSLSIMKLHYKIEQAGYLISVASLFQYPSVRQLSHFLHSNTGQQIDLVDAQSRAEKKRLKSMRKKR